MTDTLRAALKPLAEQDCESWGCPGGEHDCAPANARAALGAPSAPSLSSHPVSATTWGEFKAAMEAAGVSDTDRVNYIDWSAPYEVLVERRGDAVQIT